jgi:hypothetical protein
MAEIDVQAHQRPGTNLALYHLAVGAALGAGGAAEEGAATGAVRTARSAFTVGEHTADYFRQRGWTIELIDETLASPARTQATRDTRFFRPGMRRNDPATAYFRADGSHVVRNDVTGDIVHISGRNDPNWITRLPNP